MRGNGTPLSLPMIHVLLAINVSSLHDSCDDLDQRLLTRHIHEQKICDEADRESYKPGVIVKDAQRWKEQANEGDGGSGSERGDGLPIEATRIFVLPAAPIQILRHQLFLAHDEVIADQNASDGTEKSGIADQPAKN